MDIKKYFLPLIGAVFGILLTANTALAFGPIMVELVRTIEIARVEIKTTDGVQGMGTVIASPDQCSIDCEPQHYTFDGTTTFINAFGAERPITELQTWSGYYASFTYRKEDDHVVKIKIIPRERIAE
tara:strand:- start:120 stop:500 length:381 start_codon:yes stop_codon:yes gene_type:complete